MRAIPDGVITQPMWSSTSMTTGVGIPCGQTLSGDGDGMPAGAGEAFITPGDGTTGVGAGTTGVGAGTTGAGAGTTGAGAGTTGAGAGITGAGAVPGPGITAGAGTVGAGEAITDIPTTTTGLVLTVPEEDITTMPLRIIITGVVQTSRPVAVTSDSGTTA